MSVESAAVHFGQIVDDAATVALAAGAAAVVLTCVWIGCLCYCCCIDMCLDWLLMLLLLYWLL